jgi:hypothetical protein
MSVTLNTKLNDSTKVITASHGTLIFKYCGENVEPGKSFVWIRARDDTSITFREVSTSSKVYVKVYKELPEMDTNCKSCGDELKLTNMLEHNRMANTIDLEAGEYLVISCVFDVHREPQQCVVMGLPSNDNHDFY